jgi:WD40 repeat protein
LRDAATHALRYALKPDEKKRQFFRNGVYPPRYAADGKLVALHGSDGTLRVVETATGKELRSLALDERDPSRPTTRRVIAPVAFAPSGQWLLVTTEGQYGELLLHGVASGLEVRRFPARSIAPFTRSIAISPQNLLVLPGQRDEVEIWDMATGERKLKARP